MRITESELRSIIKKTINEMSESPEMSMSVLSKRVEACMGMDKRMFLKMCAEICHASPDMTQHCFDLCEAVLCEKDVDKKKSECLRCLEKICCDEKCCDICVRCCGC